MLGGFAIFVMIATTEYLEAKKDSLKKEVNQFGFYKHFKKMVKNFLGLNLPQDIPPLNFNASTNRCDSIIKQEKMMEEIDERLDRVLSNRYQGFSTYPRNIIR
uniref:Uncharacterized protein n=1 Tax=Panagrolaimus sp. PS1159 TaxID=55785 RepID=A0AC35GVF5_9BILA